MKCSDFMENRIFNRIYRQFRHISSGNVNPLLPSVPYKACSAKKKIFQF